MLFDLWSFLRRRFVFGNERTTNVSRRGCAESDNSPPVFNTVNALPKDAVQDFFPLKLEELCRLRYFFLVLPSPYIFESSLSVGQSERSLLTGVVSPLGSSSSSFSSSFSSSQLSSFHIKALNGARACPSLSLADYLKNGENGCFTVTALKPLDASCKDLIHETNYVLRQSPPELCTLGTGGVYFFKSNCEASDNRNVSAVFKPIDEEPGERNNPKGHCCCFSGNEVEYFSMKDGFRPGEGALRECAAYLLDHGSISGIPPTALVSLKTQTSVFCANSNIEKIGSLQKYIPFEFDAEECGPGLFPVHEVHKICVADLRFINQDRNGQNILYSRTADGNVILTPIDHGYCFPNNLKDIHFEWMNWKQAEQTFGTKIQKFIEGLDPRKDLEVLHQNGIELPPECVRVFLFSNYFLKWSVCHRHLTPRDIAVVMTNAPGASTSSPPRCSKIEEVYQAILKDNDDLGLEEEIYRALDNKLGAVKEW